MTGYGKSEGNIQDQILNIEIRCLNSKSLDLNLKLPSELRELEWEVRKLLVQKLVRGKIDVYIKLTNSTDISTGFNEQSIREAIFSLQQIVPSASIDSLLPFAIRASENNNDSKLFKEEEFALFFKILQEAIAQVQEFRATEGASIEIDVKNSLQAIRQLSAAISLYEKDRLHQVTERYKKALEQFEIQDETRFYQEMAFYTEKYDINEEKIRLQQHLDYFEEIMATDNPGKKLGFIAQEMGREINTIGSKANHADIQKLVVEMKDYLEKIKEITLNIL